MKGIGGIGGLVGSTVNCTITNSHASGSVTGSASVGGLVGSTFNSTITNSYATGSVIGISSQVGGLVGTNYLGTITNSYATGIVMGDNYVGGLVGDNDNSSITNSYATGSVSGVYQMVGGLTGSNFNASITNSYATGSVSGTVWIGGLVGCSNGYNNGSAKHESITNSYATGGVTGHQYVGGLVGENYFCNIINSYAAGSVTGVTDSNGVGGLVGYNDTYNGGVSITNSYATGRVTGQQYVGGLVGYNHGSIITTNSFWDITTSGQATSAGGTGVTSTEMLQLSTFTSWNTATPNTIANTGGSGAVWRIYEGHTSPLLTSFLTPLTLADAPDVTTTYNGSSQSANTTTTNIPLVLGSAATGTNAGFYNGYYSIQQGYDITGGNLTINKLVPKVVTLKASKTYDGTTTLGVGTVTIETGVTVNGITESLGYNGATAYSKNVADNAINYIKSITLLDGTGLASNYVLPSLNHTNAPVTITPKALNMIGLFVPFSKVYDGTTKAVVTGTKKLAVEAVGQGNASDGKSYTGDTVSITGTAVGTYDSKDVATASTVTYSGLSLTGSQAGNYTLNQSSASTKITPKALTMSGLSVVTSKVYDGTTSALVSGTQKLAAAEAVGQGTATDGKSYSGDMVSITGTAVGNYNSKDVPTASTVTYSGLSLTGSQAGNYMLTNQSPASAKITPKTITMSGLSVAAKVYDATTKAVVTDAKTLATGETAGQGTASDGKSYIGDSVSLSGTAVGTYNSKDVVTASTVTYSGLSLTGSQAGNYTLTIQSPASAKITPKALSMSGLSVAASKVYDGTTKAVVTGTKTLSAAEAAGTGTSTDGKSYTGDVVSLTGTAVGTYNSKDVASASTVTYSGLSLTGSQAANYTLTIQSPAIAKITPKALTMSGLTVAGSKVYDGTTNALVGGTNTLAAAETAGTGNTTDGKSYTGDSVSITGTAVGTYNSKDVATASAVTFSGLSLTGSQAGNYTLKIQSPASAKITKKTVTLSATKTYDGTTTLGANTVTIGTGVIVNGITELLGYSGATANSKNIADNATNYIKTITLLNGTGGLAANYVLPTLNHANAPVTIK